MNLEIFREIFCLKLTVGKCKLCHIKGATVHSTYQKRLSFYNGSLFEGVAFKGYRVDYWSPQILIESTQESRGPISFPIGSSQSTSIICHNK